MLYASYTTDRAENYLAWRPRLTITLCFKYPAIHSTNNPVIALTDLHRRQEFNVYEGKKSFKNIVCSYSHCISGNAPFFSTSS